MVPLYNSFVLVIKCVSCLIYMHTQTYIHCAIAWKLSQLCFLIYHTGVTNNFVYILCVCEVRRYLVRQCSLVTYSTFQRYAVSLKIWIPYDTCHTF